MKKLSVMVFILTTTFTCLGADRNIEETWNVRTGPGREQELKWFQSESIVFTLTSKDGDYAPYQLTNDNLQVIWEITGYDDFTNVFAVTTGSVLSVSNGISQFSLTPIQTSLTNGTYRGFAKAIVTNGAGTITKEVVLAWQKISIEYSIASENYVLQSPFSYYTAAQVDLITDAIAANLAVVSGRVTAVEGYTNEAHTAYGWGDHGVAGYATGTPLYVESDPAWHSGTGAIYEAIAEATDTNLAAQVAALSNRTDAVEIAAPEWDGGTNGLDEVAGRLSLGLGTAATNPATAFVSSTLVDQPDGVAGLDANGQISTNAIPSITVIFTGGERE